MKKKARTGLKYLTIYRNPATTRNTNLFLNIFTHTQKQVENDESGDLLGSDLTGKLEGFGE